MGKWVASDVLDGALRVSTAATRLVALNAQPADFADALAGRVRDAAVLLGWGRNTLTRKIKELGMKVDGADDDDGDEG